MIKKKSKAQISMEFLLSVGIIMLIFIAVMIVANFRRGEVLKYEEMIELKNPCDKMTSMINNVYALGDGAEMKDDGVEFNITILAQTRQVLVWERRIGRNRTYYCSFVPFNLTNSYNTSFVIRKRTEFTVRNNDGNIEILNDLLTEGLVLWLKMDEDSGINDIVDSSEVERNITIVGPDCSVKGFRGKGCFFDGGNDEYIETGNYNYGMNWTICAWIYPTGTSYIFDSDTINPGGDKWGLININSPATPVIDFKHSGTSKITEPIELNQWRMICFTDNVTHLSYYENGTLITSTDIRPDSSEYAFNDKLLIGYSHSSGQFFDGIIDDVRLYNRTLSDSEIKSLYEVYFNYVKENQDDFVR